MAKERQHFREPCWICYEKLPKGNHHPFCRSHIKLIQRFIDAYGYKGAEAWLNRNLENQKELLSKALRDFAREIDDTSV